MLAVRSGVARRLVQRTHTVPVGDGLEPGFRVTIFTLFPLRRRFAGSIQVTIPRCWVVQQPARMRLRTGTSFSA
jgi:hypothetical protein